jgi:Domain of unknown function (DUF6379)
LVTLAAGMLGEDALRAAGEGFELDVHLNWYRSLPLSCVETVEVAIDGEWTPREAITFVADGAEYALGDLREQWQTYWFVLDPVTLRVRFPRAVEPGERVDVTVRLGVRIPYILVGRGQPLEVVSERSQTLTAR